MEKTLNELLDAGADALCNTPKYSRSPERTDMRAGQYTRKLHTGAGEVELKVPKVRKATFETAIIERYRRREASVEESLIEMYLAACRSGGWRRSRRRCGARGSVPRR